MGVWQGGGLNLNHYFQAVNHFVRFISRFRGGGGAVWGRRLGGWGKESGSVKRGRRNAFAGMRGGRREPSLDVRKHLLVRLAFGFARADGNSHSVG